MAPPPRGGAIVMLGIPGGVGGLRQPLPRRHPAEDGGGHWPDPVDLRQGGLRWATAIARLFLMGRICSSILVSSRSSLREVTLSLVNLARVPLDGARAEEQRAPISGLVRPHWPVSRSAAPGGEIGERVDSALAHPLAGGGQLETGTLGEGLDATRAQHLVGGPQLARAHPSAALTPRSLATEEMGAGQFRADDADEPARDRSWLGRRLDVAPVGRCGLPLESARLPRSRVLRDNLRGH
jgi:hypothetical protein